MENNEGNAEIMGVVLLIAIFVGAITLMGVMMLSAPQPEKVPAVAFDFWSDENNKSVSLIHRGGETLNLNGTVLRVIYSNGTTSENPSVIIDGGTPDYWTHISSSSSSSPYSIGDVINLTASAGSIDQVQLIWPGTGSGGSVLLGAWSTNSSSGKNPPAAVTGAVPITFPYPSEGPIRAQPTQTPAVPWVYFIADKTAVNETALGINFTNLTENQGNYGLLWNFEDEDTTPSLTRSITHTYSEPAWPSNIENYTVKLTLTDGNNPTQYNLSRLDYISVYKAPHALFRTSPDIEGNSPFTVSFHDESTGYVTDWLWTFGDGETLNQQNPIHEFTYIPGYNPSNYTVILKAIDPFESKQSDPVIIKVHQPLIANFTNNPTQGSVGIPVQCNDTSTGDDIFNWFWDFGDGVTSNYQNTTHTYATAGTYNVSLNITNPWGTNTTTRPFTVISAPLVANFTNTTSTIGNSELTVQFKDISTGNPTSWLWAFGDGTTSLEQNPSHTYTNLGTTPKTYNVTLTVNNTDESSTITKTEFITVYPPLVAAFGLVNWTYNAMDTVRFADNSTGYNIERWTWDFGDDTTSAFQYPGPANVSHIYTAAGNYTVNLTIANPYGTNVSQPAVVRVLSPLVANFTANRTAGNAQLPIQFNDTSTGDGINGWSWDFGDNTTASLQNVTHIYSTAGIYNVTLTAYNDYGNNTTTRTDYITVLQPPVAAFNGTPTLGNGQINVNFTDLSTGEGITNWNWDFGDGNTSTSQNPLHLYTNLETIPKTYNVTLTINNTFEVNATTQTRYITVYPSLVADFTTTATTGDAPLEVDFTDTSTGYDIIGWTWDFGDGVKGSLQNASHTYATPGIYAATLTVTNPAGSAQTSRTITVTAPPTTPLPPGGWIIGTVYNDQNGDGLANTSDPKLAGWTVNLLQNGVVIETTTSDAAGAYGFYKLQKGKYYTIAVVLPVGWQGTNPAGGSYPDFHITGSDDQFPNIDFWNYYKPVSTGGDFTLNAAKPGSLVSNGYLQFTSRGSDNNIGVTVGGQFVRFNDGDTVKIAVTSTEAGTIYIGGGQISTMQLQNAAVYINNMETPVRTGQITLIDTHGGYSNLTSTLTVTVPSRDVWTSFTVDHAQVIAGQNDSRIINLYNITTGGDGVLNLRVGADVYIVGSTGTYQLLP
ncbi:PKD domain-containing protein [Methanosphaerula subterraneus]|uniref:PKD domain-containing protein n=1 Tax=Methanosphaerula subterraneus TaxID=3350244 RepID=UPI003F858240